MNIFMIFEATEDLDAAWLVDAWDEYTMDASYERYEAAVKKARKESPSGEIRIIKTTVNDTKILDAFKVPSVPNTAEESN